MVTFHRSKFSLLCLASTLALSIGAVDAYAQCAPDPGPGPEPGPEPTARDNQSHDDGRCEHQAGLISGQNIYCGSRKTAHTAPREYTFAQLWSGIKSAFGRPGEAPPYSEPTIKLAKYADADEQPGEPQSASKAPDLPPSEPMTRDDNGLYFVQLAAMSSEDAARRYWSDLPTAFSLKAEGLNARFEPVATVPSRQELYAVRTGPFDGENAARSWCSDLLQADIDCFIIHP